MSDKFVAARLVLCVLLTLTVGCRGKQAAFDPASRFTDPGPERVRELGVYSGDKRVGDLTFAARDGKWDQTVPARELSEAVTLRLSFRGDRFEMASVGRSWVDGELGLLGSVAQIDFGAGGWETRAIRTGPGTFQREQITGGSRSREKVTIPEKAVLTDVLPLFLNRNPGEVGKERSMGVHNLTLGQDLPFTSVYHGQTPMGRSFTVRYWGMEERLWLDDDGMVTREEMALGVVAREPGDGEVEGALPLEQILSRTAVPGTGIPDDLGARSKAEITLEGSFRKFPDTRWQTVKMGDGSATVTLESPRVPPPGARVSQQGESPADTFGLDLDSSRIRELAAEVTKGVQDPWEKALAVGRWVYGNLGKSMRECFSALTVLEAGEGECQSHSLLTVALCRASGVPARFAYGVVYLPDRDAFLFHTWVEVHVGEWIPIDPTLGNFPAGVDHLTLAVGGYRDQLRLFPFIMGKGGWRISMPEARDD
ncbi:MAG: transglutaminase-like domain-containing protein [bacterium]|nr:transglutaminase-like domain-containing protein [bacterium]